MANSTIGIRGTIRRWFQLPISAILKQIPRILARMVYFALPLYLTYGDTTTSIVNGKALTTPKYPHEWPVIVLVVSYCVVGLYKFYNRESDIIAQQRIFDSSAAGSLKRLQALVLDCPDHNSLDSIHQSLLAVIVDKVKQLILESRSGVVSANLMIADDAAQKLSLTLFSHDAPNRERIDVNYGAPGAGRAIVAMRPVLIPDVKDPNIAPHFRADAPYRSILSIPMACTHRKLGVVNVDSTEPDGLSEEIVAHLEPYVQLIGLSLCLNL